jgi:hypothetical protein
MERATMAMRWDAIRRRGSVFCVGFFVASSVLHSTNSAIPARNLRASATPTTGRNRRKLSLRLLFTAIEFLRRTNAALNPQFLEQAVFADANSDSISCAGPDGRALFWRSPSTSVMIQNPNSRVDTNDIRELVSPNLITNLHRPN